MSFLKQIFYSFGRTIGRLLAYIFIAFIIFFVFSKLSNAKETGRAFYNGLQVGDTFTYSNSGNNTASWENVQVQTLRYDNNNIIMTSGKNYTFSAKFLLGEVDSINATNSIEVDAGYLRNGKIYDFSGSTCSYDFETKNLTPPVGGQKYYMHTIYINCEKISFSTGNNQLIVRFKLNNTNNDYYNLLQLNPLNIIFKETSSLTDSDKIIINQNQNTQNVINNQNENTNKIIVNQNENADKIVDSITDSKVPSVTDTPKFELDDGPISGLLTMPITWFNAFTNPKACVPINFGTLYGHDLTIPCINPKKYLGEDLWSVIDLFIVVTMIISLSQLLLFVINQFRNLDDLYNWYYTPRHAKGEYEPRHAKE